MATTSGDTNYIASVSPWGVIKLNSDKVKNKSDVVGDTVTEALDNLAAGGGGETNTASNLGVGANVFKQKTGEDLEFRSILAGNNRLLVVEGTDEVSLTVQPSNIDLEDLGNVDSAPASSGDVLIYNGVSSEWEAQPQSAVSAAYPTFNNGTLSEPGIRFIDSTNTGVYRNGASGDLNVVRAGTLAANFHSTGVDVTGIVGSSSDRIKLNSGVGDGNVLVSDASGNFISTAQDSADLLASRLASATTAVDVSAATAPTVGQVLTATSSTSATWQAVGGADALEDLSDVAVSGMSDGDVLTYNAGAWVNSAPSGGTQELYPASTGVAYATNYTWKGNPVMMQRVTGTSRLANGIETIFAAANYNEIVKYEFVINRSNGQDYRQHTYISSSDSIYQYEDGGFIHMVRGAFCNRPYTYTIYYTV